MRSLVVSLVLALAAMAPALAFDAQVESALATLKVGKPVPRSALAIVMQNSERWCYFEAEGQCRWSDVYLDVTPETARFEIGNAWDDALDIYFIDEGVFADDGQICQSHTDGSLSVRAVSRADGTALGGRELDAIRQDLAGNAGGDTCFDYNLEAIDAEAQTVTLLQRQYLGGVLDPSGDAPVTIHFDPASARALGFAF